MDAHVVRCLGSSVSQIQTKSLCSNITNMSKEKIQALDQKLSAQRTQWSDTIRGLARGLKKVDGMEQVIAETLSSRQTCVDQIAYLNVKIKEQKSLWNK